MFGFKKKEKIDNQILGSLLGTLSNVIASNVISDNDFSKFNAFKKTAAISELQRLKDDHWDKDAFDRVIRTILEL